MGVTVGVLCDACTNEALEIRMEAPVHREVSEVVVAGGDAGTQSGKEITPLTKTELSRPDISGREGISRRASAASTVADPPHQSREAVSEVTEGSNLSDVDVSEGWADWTMAAALCENSNHQPVEQHQQVSTAEINLGSLAPDVPHVLPRFACLEVPQPSWIVAARSLSEVKPPSRSVGTQAPEGRLPEDLSPTVLTSTGEQQRLQPESKQELQQEPVRELLPPQNRIWPLLPSVGTWLVLNVTRTSSHTAATTTELEATAEVAEATGAVEAAAAAAALAAAVTEVEPKETDDAPSIDDRPQDAEVSSFSATACQPVMAWNTLPSVGTWLGRPPGLCHKGIYSAATVSFPLHAQGSTEVVQDVEELRKGLLSNLGVKPTKKAPDVDPLLVFDPYAPCAKDESGQTFHGSNGQDECPVS
mmetsp:Transcript_77066/g.152712  ORF Transcript_77066/g.152712 Transcript_77066/m.152712 type:complete len:418 (-) Transcript_77066:79-1332(-)